jgi:hypothetical protein
LTRIREELSLGYRVGISGAAFSTGIGARTNLGLSMLCALSNVRLGYWRDSYVEPSRRPQWAPSLRRRLAASLTRWVFLVQTCLLDELLARFPGSAARRWYLSDGGHFENLGGYELIRRRLPRILVIDAEADPQYHAAAARSEKPGEDGGKLAPRDLLFDPSPLPR